MQSGNTLVGCWIWFLQLQTCTLCVQSTPLDGNTALLFWLCKALCWSSAWCFAANTALEPLRIFPTAAGEHIVRFKASCIFFFESICGTLPEEMLLKIFSFKKKLKPAAPPPPKCSTRLHFCSVLHSISWRSLREGGSLGTVSLLLYELWALR